MAKAARAERGSLSAERIEVTALVVIEVEGLDGFSIRKLAAKLGCEAMSVYHYFPSKAHLMAALVDRVIAADLRVLEPSAENWRARIEGASREWQAMVRRRPAFYAILASQRLTTAAGLRWLNGILGVYASLRLGEETAARMAGALTYYLKGAGIDEAAAHEEASTSRPVAENELAAKYPNVASPASWLGDSQREATFELGLRVLLDSIERMIERRLL